MTINWNGETEACCENYKEEYSLGNINDKSIEEIWNGDKFKAIRNAHYCGEWWKIPQCKKCTLHFTK
jgi:radical SAM protein with 4Fe4S-binding SPASM domain